MKKFFLFASAVVLSVSVFAQGAQQKAEDAVNSKSLHMISARSSRVRPSVMILSLTNISDKPGDHRVSHSCCGCTTPVKPEGAIQQGKDDKITAGFNAQAMGPFNKNITVKVAGIDLPVTLHITGEVLSAPDYANISRRRTRLGR